jgi:branched-chain amino acid transport system substrate-binding protein
MCTLLLDYSYGHSLDESFTAHYTQVRPEGQIVHQARPPLGETDYTTHITSILNAGCQGVFANLWGSHFPGFAKQAATFGFFDRVRYISAGEISSPEIAGELGADYPDGVWGNSYEAFYYPDTPEHNEYLTLLREEVGSEYTPSFPIVGYIAVQFLAEAIRQAGTTETEAVAEALRGLTINTPVGPMTMREDQQANRGEFWGEMNPSTVAGYPNKVMNPVEYIPADDIMD